VLLDRLLERLSVDVDPFAVCSVSSGWRLKLPGPPDVMLHFVLEGNGFLQVPEGEDLPLHPYTLAVVPHGVVHSLVIEADAGSEQVISGGQREGEVLAQLVAGSIDETEFRVACGLIQVTYGDTLALFRYLPRPTAVDLSGFPQVRAAFEGILAEQSADGPGSLAMTTALMNQCLVYLLRRLAQQVKPPLSWLSALEDPGLGEALELMTEHPGEDHTVESLAEAAMMSRSTFATRFREAFGHPPLAFLQELRLRRGAELLRRDDRLSIDQVAHRVGFASRSHFARSFKTQFGATPSAFRSSPEALTR
jgi:AraC-like DNA-binding protein